MCPGTDTSAQVPPVGEKVCMTVDLPSRQIFFSPFGGNIFRGHQMWGQEMGLGGPFLASLTPIFAS